MSRTLETGWRRGCAALTLAAAATLGAAPALAQTSGKSFPPARLLTQPADPVAYYRDSLLAAKLVEEKKWAEAEALLVRLTRDYPFDTAWAANYSNWGRLALVLREQGKCEAAIAAYQRVVDLQGPGLGYAGGSNPLYWIAFCQAKLGRTAAALDSLERMVGVEHYLTRPELIDDDSFAALKNEPRFKAIAGKATAPQDRVAGWRGDIDYLTSEVKRSQPAGAVIPAEYYSRERALKAALPKLGDEEVAAGMMRMVATLDRGHTGLWLGAPGTRQGLQFKPMPIRLYQFPDGMFITEAWGGYEDLVGARVLKLGEVTAEDALARLAASVSSESPSEVLGFGPALMLIRPALLKGLGFTPDADKAVLTVRMKDGAVRTRTVAAAEEPPREDWSRRLNAPPGVTPPLFLSHVRENHWFQALPEADAVYVQVNNIIPDKDETLPEFGLRLRKALAGHSPKSLIVDIRQNNGGNSFSYVELLRTITAFSAQDGRRVYVITGRFVYSAAANFSADLERLAKPVFVGEPTGGTGNQWGDESVFVLPYSGIMGAISGVRWQLSNPWDRRRSIVPQVPVQLTAKAYFAGEDPVMDTVLRLIREDTAG